MKIYFVETSLATLAMEEECIVVEAIPDFEVVSQEIVDLPEPVVGEIPPSCASSPLASKYPPPAPKKRKVTTQDIQAMQLDVLTMEKEKIALDMENIKLSNEKLRLEIQELLSRAQPINFD